MTDTPTNGAIIPPLSGAELPPGHIGRKILVLKAITMLKLPNRTNIHALTGISHETIHQIINKLNTEAGMEIVRVGAKRYGHYEIHNWGIFNKDAVLEYQLKTTADE